MTAKNRQMKENLKMLYHCRCFLTGLKESKNNKMTFHHIEKQVNKGATSTENGANLVVLIHRWLHKQECVNIELYYLVNECLKLYKKCMDEEKHHLIEQWEEECLPLFIKEMRKR